MTDIPDYMLIIGLVEIIVLTAGLFYLGRKNKKKGGNP